MVTYFLVLTSTNSMEYFQKIHRSQINDVNYMTATNLLKY